jgi:hypothetical protein
VGTLWWVDRERRVSNGSLKDCVNYELLNIEG